MQCFCCTQRCQEAQLINICAKWPVNKVMMYNILEELACNIIEIALRLPQTHNVRQEWKTVQVIMSFRKLLTPELQIIDYLLQ